MEKATQKTTYYNHKVVRNGWWWFCWKTLSLYSPFLWQSKAPQIYSRKYHIFYIHDILVVSLFSSYMRYTEIYCWRLTLTTICSSTNQKKSNSSNKTVPKPVKTENTKRIKSWRQIKCFKIRDLFPSFLSKLYYYVLC